MKHLLACLALCASLSSYAQDDNCTVLGIQEIGSAYTTLNEEFDSIKTSLSNLQESVSSLSTKLFSSQSGPTTFAGDTIGSGVQLKQGRTYMLVIGGGGFGWTYSGCCFAASAKVYVHSSSPNGLAANVYPSSPNGQELWYNSPCWTHYPRPSKTYYVQSLEDQTWYFTGKNSTSTCMTGGTASVVVIEL